MKTLLNSIKIIAIATVLAVGVSYVYAFTSPNGSAPTVNPDNNVPSIVDVGGPSFQTKVGSFTTESFFKAGTNSTPGLPGWIIAANGAGAPDNGGVTSPWQFFQKEYLINKPGTFAQMKVGSHIAGRPNSPLPSVDKTKFDPKDASIPLTIDLIDRGTGNNSDAGTQVMDLLAGDVCNNATTVQTNTAGIQFWSTKNINPNTNTAGDNADVIARGIQIGDSSAGAMKVLVATDTAGNAVWGTMRIANGQVVVDYPGSSDVAAGQMCEVAPVLTYRWVTLWSGCKYFDDTAVGNGYLENPSSNVCKDQNNNTVANSLCPQPAPGPRQAASSLPLCSCQAYQLKANCNGGSTVYVPNGCTKITLATNGTCASGNPQEIYNIECSSPQTEQSISSGAAAAGFGATHLNNQNPQQCTGANAPMTAWMCHTAGTAQWVTAESRGEDITCTGPYLPTGTFSEGDIVCAENRPGFSLCKTNGAPNSNCRPGDSICPN